MIFSHIALNCKDPIATETFYSRHFGFRRARVIPIGEGQQIVFLRMDGEMGTVYLELFPSNGDSPGGTPHGDGPTYTGVRHLAFKVDDVDASLAAMGDDARIMQGPMSFDDVIPGWRTVWIADPDGNIVEISQGYTDEDSPPPLE